MHITLSLSDAATYCCQPALAVLFMLGLPPCFPLPSLLPLALSLFHPPFRQTSSVGVGAKTSLSEIFHTRASQPKRSADRNGRMQQDYLVKI